MPQLDLERSRKIFARARELMPGGVNSPARAFGAVGGEPIVIHSANGACLTDVDGARYIDYVGSWGPMILGHCHPAVVAAVREAVDRGSSFGAPTEAENTLAELIVSAVPSIEKVRLVSSGTEAAMSAIRLARAATGRDGIVKFAGNYHGHVDALLVAAGSSAATLGAPDSPGVTAGAVRDTLVLEYNDVAGLEACFDKHGERIACLVMEPVVGNMGCVRATVEFAAAARELTFKHGALLLFDEVMCGFRVAYGGAQELLGVTPDITTLGKIVGGGLPLGAFGGKAEIMDHLLPVGKVFQAGTLSGNPLATAAGAATLKQLRDHPPYARLEAASDRLAKGFSAAAAEAGVPHRVQRVGSMLTLFFVDENVLGWKQASRADTAMFAKFFWGMLRRGVYLPCSQFEAMFVSTRHGDEEIDRTIQAARATLREIA